MLRVNINRTSKSNWKKAPRDGKSRYENGETQPKNEYRIFNNPTVITEAWYPVCLSQSLPMGQVQSHTIGLQRFILYRGDDGIVRGMDAFCPHMGADLGNGKVVGNEIQCYFHQWKFNCEGRLSKVRCLNSKQDLPKNVELQTYPVEEKYGTIWIYSAAKAPYPVPVPSGLEGKEVSGFQLTSRLLFAHHHVMMAGAIDLQHFATVHNLDIQFNYEVTQKSLGCFDWILTGEIPTQNTWRIKLARWLLGNQFGYHSGFAGGSIIALTYGPEQFFRGKGFKLPPLYLLWGCVPQKSGVSRVHIFILQEQRKGLGGWIVQKFLYGLTLLLLTVLRDDDVKAFPYMRFDAKNLLHLDKSVARLISLINTLNISKWNMQPEDKYNDQKTHS